MLRLWNIEQPRAFGRDASQPRKLTDVGNGEGPQWFNGGVHPRTERRHTYKCCNAHKHVLYNVSDADAAPERGYRVPMMQPDDILDGTTRDLDDNGTWVGLRRVSHSEFHLLRDYDGSRENITVWIRSAGNQDLGWRVDRTGHQLGEHFPSWGEALASGAVRSREALRNHRPVVPSPPAPPFSLEGSETSSFSPLASDDRKERRKWAMDEANLSANDPDTNSRSSGG
jgi:hypothetical protein